MITYPKPYSIYLMGTKVLGGKRCWHNLSRTPRDQWGNIRVISGVYADDGTESGHFYNGLFRVQAFKFAHWVLRSVQTHQGEDMSNSLPCPSPVSHQSQA